MSEPLIIGSYGYVARIDATTGEEVWRTKLLPGVFGGTSGTDVTVLVRSPLVFAGTNGNLFCLDLNTGQVLWRNELKGMSYENISLAVEGVSIQHLNTTTSNSSST